jgi:hypothetical protein
MYIVKRRLFFGGVFIFALGFVYALSGILFTHRPLSVIAGSLLCISGLLTLIRGAFRWGGSGKQ